MTALLSLSLSPALSHLNSLLPLLSACFLLTAPAWQRLSPVSISSPQIPPLLSSLMQPLPLRLGLLPASLCSCCFPCALLHPLPPLVCRLLAGLTLLDMKQKRLAH